MISVVVPVYRVESYLDRCVKSILNQTFSDFELILVDDGSPDRCPEICDDWARKDDRIRVIHKKNGGLPDARNAGIAAATGEYLAFVDSDDWVEPEFLETLYKGIVAYGADVVQCNYQKIFENEVVQLSSAPKVFDPEAIQCDILAEMANDRLSGLANARCNKLYKTGLVKNSIALCDTSVSMGEDFLMNFAVFGLCRKIVAMDTPPLYNYFYNTSSITGSYSPGYRLSKPAYLANLQRIAKKYGCDMQNMAYLINRSCADYIYVCAISRWSRADKKKEIREIIGTLDRKLWLSCIRTYDIQAERVCQYMSYFGLVGPMLWLVDVVKKIKGIA